MKKWIIHFDLNRTILMSDAAGGRSIENTVNYILSECSWGYINHENNWICLSKEPSLNFSHSMEYNGLNKKDIITYKSYIDHLYPYMDGDTINNNKIKLIKRQYESDFTVSGPGRELRSTYDKIMKMLLFPTEKEREEAQKASLLVKNKGRLKEAWSEGKYFLLPSFLKFLLYLDHYENENNKLNMNLIFRTFGDDLMDIQEEIDFFIKGLHPLYPGLKISQKFRLNTLGSFYRDSSDTDGTTLIMNSLEKVPFGSEKTPETFYPPNTPMSKGFENIYKKLENLTENTKVIGLRDYWDIWHSHGETAKFGKLLLIHSNSKTHVTFFDDHIKTMEPHIVDVRDVSNKDFISLSFKSCLEEGYLRRADPYQAIIDEDYFVKEIEKIRMKIQ